MKYRIDYYVRGDVFMIENDEVLVDEEAKKKGYKLPYKIDNDVVLEKEKYPYVVFEDNIAPISSLFDEVLGSGNWIMSDEVAERYKPNPTPEELMEYKKYKETFLREMKEFRQAQASGEKAEKNYPDNSMEYYDTSMKVEFFYDGSIFFAPWSMDNDIETDLKHYSAKQEIYIELEDYKKIYKHYLFIQSRINVIPNFITKVERSEVAPEEQVRGNYNYNPALFKITDEWYDTNDDNPIYKMNDDELEYKVKTKLDLERESKELLGKIKEMVKKD